MNNQNNGKQWLGITEPISLAGPTEEDVTKTHELEKVIVFFLFFFLLRIFMYFRAFLSFEAQTPNTTLTH